jgi:DNA-binding transcriptional regulator YiaG
MDRTLLSLQQAVSMAKSPPRGGRKRWRRPTADEIKALRKRLELSQAEFARKYGLDPGSLKHWEHNRRAPEQSSCLLLKMIACEPQTMARLVHLVQHAADEKENELEPA